MRLVNNRKEPRKLQVHRYKRGTTYESFSSEIGLGEISPPSGFRKKLLDDQGYICAYCMKRIPHKFIEKGIAKDDFKIEHYISQKSQISKISKLDITYKNMFACCMGNEGQKEEYQTCDTRKGNKSISISPLISAHLRTVFYAPDGSIHSSNKSFEKDIDKVLNLNEDNLKQQREAIYKFIEKKVIQEFKTPHLTRLEKNQFLDTQIAWWDSKINGKYNPFCMVAIKYLESRKR